MENANVLVVEDNATVRTIVRTLLESAGHTAHESTTRADAIDKIAQIRAGKLACNLLILDGNLTPGSQHAEDARAILECVDQAGVPLRRIALSALPFPADLRRQIDADVGKTGLDQLLDVIEELPEPDEPEVA